MKFLAVLPRVVFPADTGAKIRNLHMFSRLSRKGDTATIVCYRNQDDSDADVERMRGLCTNLELVPWREHIKTSPRALVAGAKNVFSPYPYSVDKYTTAPMVNKIRELLARETYDGIVVDTVFMARAMVGLKLPPSVCFEHNVEFVIRQRQFESEKRLPVKAFFWYDYQRMRRFEGQLGTLFDHLIMVSPKDCETIGSLGVKNTTAVPLGVDTDEFTPDWKPEAGGDVDLPNPATDLVFTGSMDWEPNQGGIRWFAEEVLPQLQDIENLRLWVVGRRPNAQLLALAESNRQIKVTGWVSDVRPYIANAAVYVVPLLVGGGTRIKIFEAMAMAKPIVSTTIGAEGLPVIHGENLLLSDTATAFADSIRKLIQQKELAAKLGGAAREMVAANYSWASAADVFAQICHDTVERRRASGR